MSWAEGPFCKLYHSVNLWTWIWCKEKNNFNVAEAHPIWFIWAASRKHSYIDRSFKYYGKHDAILFCQHKKMLSSSFNTRAVKDGILNVFLLGYKEVWYMGIHSFYATCLLKCQSLWFIFSLVCKPVERLNI